MTSKEATVAYIWRYLVKPARVDAFREAYGPGGVWADYFSRSAEYLGTDLYEDLETPGCFVTIDYFADAGARGELVAREADAFAEIDAKWEKATLEEVFIGQFSASVARGLDPVATAGLPPATSVL